MPNVSGRTAIAQLAARGLAGGVWFWPGWGHDLRQYCLSKYPERQIAAAAKQQVQTDERIRACSVRAVQTGNRIKLTIAIITEDGDSFSFTLSIDEAAVSLIHLQE